jgi:hypothetical protein
MMCVAIRPTRTLVWPTWAMGVISDYDDYDNKPVWPTWAVGFLSDYDDRRPIWPTWAVGALFRGARRI